MDEDPINSDRARLFAIAYRMLGSASDAEDVLQDAWLRYQAVDPSTIRSPKAFVATIVTRLCLDRLKSAQVSRQDYVGPWLPEPVLTRDVDDPDAALQRSESLTLAFLVLLEALSPEERAVFILKDVFEYDHAEVARMLGMSLENSRQLLHRAKTRLARGRLRPTGTADGRRAVAERLVRAFMNGDGQELTTLLARDVGLWSDGGGKATAARRPLCGRDEVVNFLIGLRRTAATAGALHQASLRIEDVNCEPALVVRRGPKLESIFVFSIEGETVVGIRVVRNPDKLARIDRRLLTLQ